MSTAIHKLLARGASAVGTIKRAIASIAVLRARFTVQPRLIRALENHPPPTDPASATRYTTISGSASCASLMPYRESRNFGSQYRENHQMGSASSFPTANAHVCLAPGSPAHG